MCESEVNEEVITVKTVDGRSLTFSKPPLSILKERLKANLKTVSPVNPNFKKKYKSDDKSYHVYSDFSLAVQGAGIAFVVAQHNDRETKIIVADYKKVNSPNCSIDGELIGMVAALKTIPDNSSVVVHTDLNCVKSLISGSVKVRDKGNIEDLHQQMRRLAIDIRFSPRKNRSQFYKWCHQAAQKASGCRSVVSLDSIVQNYFRVPYACKEDTLHVYCGYSGTKRKSGISFLIVSYLPQGPIIHDVQCREIDFISTDTSILGVLTAMLEGLKTVKSGNNVTLHSPVDSIECIKNASFKIVDKNNVQHNLLAEINRLNAEIVFDNKANRGPLHKWCIKSASCSSKDHQGSIDDLKEIAAFSQTMLNLTMQ